MGSVGINFGSATSGAGFDVAATVKSILAAQQGIEAPVKAQLSALQAQDAVFTLLGTHLSTLTTSLQSLTDLTGPLAEKQGSSSNTNVVTLTSADTTAVAGSHTLVVNSLATATSDVSDPLPSASDVLSGNLQIHDAGGIVHTFTVDPTTNTLASFAAAINSASVGVNASVITDVSGSRLSLVSNASGSSSAFSVVSNLTDTTHSNTSIGFTYSAGTNSDIILDGTQLHTASNTVTGAIQGVTFQLLSSPPSTTVQIQVTNDNTAVETAVQSLVTAYNAVVKDINGQEKSDASGKAEPLLGSPTLSAIQSQLQAALFGGAASGNVTGISQLGVSSNQDGTLTFDASTLDTALNTHFSDVAGFLQSSTSFGQSFASALNSLGTQAPYGAVFLAQQQNSTQETAINADITKQDAAIAKEQITLTAELNAANQQLQAIPQELNQVNEIYSAISGYNRNTGG